MNNEKLFEMFIKIAAVTNSFDRYIQLQQAKKQYKKSDFYKQTHLSFMKAYEWFIKDGISHLIIQLKYNCKAEKIGEYITNILDNIAPDAVEQLVNRIIESLNTTDLINSSKELQDILQSFK